MILLKMGNKKSVSLCPVLLQGKRIQFSASLTFLIMPYYNNLDKEIVCRYGVVFCSFLGLWAMGDAFFERSRKK